MNREICQDASLLLRRLGSIPQALRSVLAHAMYGSVQYVHFAPSLSNPTQHAIRCPSLGAERLCEHGLGRGLVVQYSAEIGLLASLCASCTGFRKRSNRWLYQAGERVSVCSVLISISTCSLVPVDFHLQVPFLDTFGFGPQRSIFRYFCSTFSSNGTWQQFFSRPTCMIDSNVIVRHWALYFVCNGYQKWEATSKGLKTLSV